MNYNSIKKNIREIGLMFLSAGLLLFLSCGSDDTKDVSSEDEIGRASCRERV